MFPTTSLLSLLMVAISLGNIAATPVAKPPPTMSFRTRMNATDSVNLLTADISRASLLMRNGRIAFSDRALGKRSSVLSSDVSNAAVTYTTTVNIGSPATEYTLLIDTGSSNTWIGATGEKTYTSTSSSVSTGQQVSVTYGSGSFSGDEYTDTVSLGSGLTISQQSIGVASSSSGTSNVDGILGIGPVGLTSGSLTGSSSTVPTVTDNLYSQGIISSNEIGIYFAPQTSSDSGGEMTFGGTDSSKFGGDITYAPITSTSPSSEYWGVDAYINYGGATIMSTNAGIVDTGTTMTLIPSDAFASYQAATGATVDSATGMLTLSAAQYSALGNLDFNIGGSTLTMTPNAQTWPRALNTALGGDADSIYLVIADIGHNSGSGFDFIAGYTFLERYYSVYDTANKRVGFASTAHTSDTSN
ncbi:hypothetical protein PLICRDRAFT_168090 [Plicaturopsis crispa FD-325 SS-3]|uniref:Unplaced genomic scaffold PLICRscaffold_19, whole genome shotgun sequence n=1 Tax=Plicaturopsis crispa FD-325 SS-3 TaxID=944288 RepID=A0A0C9SQS7_PLICR|nr:hypothetical protein PLICRDRAFT_168090 [Plicaturopsis crispa FD-325 SS-3]